MIFLRASIRDIAKETGLSIATISRFLNSPDKVSKKSSIIIEEAINKLNYIPNRNVRAVFGKRTNTIGLIVPSLVNPFFSELSTKIGNLSQNEGNGLILCFTEDNFKKEDQALKLLLEYRVDGIIVARSAKSDLYNNIQIPVVSFETKINKEIPTIQSDNKTGGKLAFEYLYNKLCNRYIYIGGPSSFAATNARREGFLQEAINRGISPIELNVDGDYHLDVEEIYNKVVCKIKFKKGDGIFVFNDITAIILMDLIKTIGLTVPEDIKIIAFDNSFMSMHSNPPLTTVEQPLDNISKVCYNRLIYNIENDKKDISNVTLPVKIITRYSA